MSDMHDRFVAVGGRRAAWVAPGEQRRQLGPRAAYLVRRPFSVEGVPRRAVLAVTSLGVHELHLNGRRVSTALLRPGWTDPARRLVVDEHDVTALLRPGGNVIGAVMAPGWYAGRIATDADAHQVPQRPELLLCVRDEQGGWLVGTDEAWQWAPSEVLATDIYDGEEVDLRLAQAAWASPSASDLGTWERVEVAPGSAAELVPAVAPPVRELAVRPVTDVAWGPDSVAVLDTGRNDNGYVRLVVRAPAGTRIRVCTGEITSVDGRVYTENLRSARCTDTFVCAGGGEEVLVPRFSFRGFRYAEVTGLPGPDALVSAERVVVGSDLAPVGHFECSEPLLNDIWGIVGTSLRANFCEVPTDCPQRDERLGWMADAMLFAPVACFAVDIEAFFDKWLDDVLDAMTWDGAFADIAPRPSGRSRYRGNPGAPAWADAGVLVPWLMWERYGRRDILERMFPAMMSWLRLVHGANPDGLWRNGRGRDYGDWVPAGPDTSHDLFATAWLYRSTVVAAEVAGLLGRAEEAGWLTERAGVVKGAFAAEFVDAGDGRVRALHPVGSPVAAMRFAPSVSSETQTGYVLAVVFGLVEGELAQRCGERLAEMVEKAGRRLETGFIGSSLLLDALAGTGHHELAYDLLLRQEWPSLGYMVRRGGTSVWERWDGLLPDGGPACPSMNSYNHYALGSMFHWAVTGACGLRPTGTAVAFERFAFAPVVSTALTWAAFRFDSPAGHISVRWERKGDDRVEGMVTVPEGSSCEVAGVVPFGARGAQLEGGVDGGVGKVLGPGEHRVVWAVPGGAAQ